MSTGTRQHTSSDIQILEQIIPAKMYNVILYNDDYTTMEFVVSVLESIFNKSEADAERITMKIHTEGLAICGTYTHEIAETKINKVYQQARYSGFPLQAKMESA